MRALARDRDARYPNAQEMRADLEAFIHAYLVLLKTGKTAASASSDKDDLD